MATWAVEVGFRPLGPTVRGQYRHGHYRRHSGAFNQSTVRFGGRGRGTWSGKTGNIDYSGAKTVSENTLRDYEDRERWAAKFSELHDNQASSDCAIQVGFPSAILTSPP